jgi:adenosylcobinamide-GDP ribazoletransferase
MKRLLIALQFLTIIPVKVRGDITDNDIAGSSIFFPVVGAIQGLVVLLSAMVLIKIFCIGMACHAAEIVSVLIVLILIVSNKGLHLDGLADTFDALGVVSTGNETVDREKRLSAMKDSRIGAIGAISIVFTILIKFILLNTIFLTNSFTTEYFLLFLMPVLSKWAMVPAMYHGTSARQDGIGRIFIEHISLKQLVISTILVMVLIGAAFSVYSIVSWGDQTHPPDGFPGRPEGMLLQIAPAILSTFIILYGFSFISVRFFKKRFGGITGDTLGAISELSEVLFLLVGVVWLSH